MKPPAPVVLIGPCEDDPTESVSQVNRCFVEGLADRYEFVPHVANRSFGGTRRSRFNLGNLWFFCRHLALWLWRVGSRRPDVVHYSINSGWALEKGLVFLRIGRWFGAKTVGHLHSGSFLDFWSSLAPGRKRRAARQLAALDAFVVLSDSWKRLVVEQLGLTPERVHVVNNPLDGTFEEQALAMPVDRDGNTILALGVMDEQKGVLDIMRAAARARGQVDFKLILAGPERQPGIRARVEQLIREHDLAAQVELRPGVWGEEKVRLFREASALMLPSYFENFPLVVLEAAAAGLPMIVSPVGATSEFFTHAESAWFVAPGDVEGLSEALVQVGRDPGLRRRMGAQARAVFLERLARANIMKSLDVVYASVLSASVQPGPSPKGEMSRTSEIS